MLIYDLVDPQELLGFIRAIPLPGLTLDRYLPNRNIDDIEYRFTRGDLTRQDAATYRAFDAQAPIGTRAGMSRVSGELPPISKKMVLGEEQRLRLRRLQGASNVDVALVNQIFDDAENLSRSVQERVELARGDLIFNGSVTIAENGVAATFDAGYDASQFDTAPVVWTDPAADILGYLLDRLDVYSARSNGALPGELLMGRKVRAAMQKNTGIVSQALGRTNGPGMATLPQVNSVLDAYGIPPLFIDDTQVSVGKVATRVIPDNKVAMLPAPGGNVLGRTFWGTTAEAIELAEARAIDAAVAPGLVAVIDKEFDPVATWTKVAGITVPTIANPELVDVLTVL